VEIFREFGWFPNFLSEFSESSTRAKFGEEFVRSFPPPRVRERGRTEESKQASAAGSVGISPKSENKIQKFENDVILQGFNRQK
jgi:hypothetical protein